MIQLREDCLLIANEDGGYAPVAVGQLTLEIAGAAAGGLDPETLRHVAAGVLHYFRDELGKTTVTIAEFGEAFAKALRGLGFDVDFPDTGDDAGRRGSDLRELAVGAGKLGELEFFPLLQLRLREHLAQASGVIEFSGLRSCVKILTGRKIWCPRCDELELKIVETLRVWFGREPAARGATLVVR
jgi:hypothetical protein